MTTTRRSLRRSSTALYVDFSSEDESPNRSNSAIVNTPIGNKSLSRGRPKKTDAAAAIMEEEYTDVSSSAPIASSSASKRQSLRKSKKPNVYNHYPYEVTKKPIIPETRLSSFQDDEEMEITDSVAVSKTPKKPIVPTEGNKKTPKMLLDLQDTPEFRARHLLSSSCSDDAIPMNLSTRHSSRERQPNKKYTSQIIGSPMLMRITSTPSSSKRLSLRSCTPKVSITANRSRRQSSSSSVSKSPPHSKSRTPKKTPGRPTNASKASSVPQKSPPRPKGRPSNASKVKTPIAQRSNTKSSSMKMKRKDETDDESEKDDKDDETTESGSSTESEEEESDPDDSDDAGLRRKKASPNLNSQRFQDMDFENALTPDTEMLKELIAKKSDNATPRRLLQAFYDNEQDSPNPESYFLAKNRLKYLPEQKIHDERTGVPNDSRKGKGKAAKKPRKGTRGLGGQRTVNLPERSRVNFSVTKEANKVAASKLVVPLTENKHAKEIESILLNNIVPDFPRWIYFMREGFNIMLHGYGSKIPVFQEFKAHLDGEWLVITVNGLYPKLHPRKFLVDLCDALEMEEKIRVVGTNMDVVAEEIYDQLKDVKHPRVFLLVRNFDSLAIRNSGFLAVLSSMARIKWIHILASSDNVNAFLGVNQNQTVQLNFCWIPCSTFQPYEEELTWVPGIFGEDNSGAGTKSTLQYVLKSLTGNARKAFSILASLQLAKTGSLKGKRAKEFAGVEFRDLARRCRERFIAHSDAALKTLLIEFIDHKLMSHSGKSKNVGNLLTVLLDNETLVELANAGL